MTLRIWKKDRISQKYPTPKPINHHVGKGLLYQHFFLKNLSFQLFDIREDN